MTTLTNIPKSIPPVTAKIFKTSLPIFWCADDESFIYDDLLGKMIVIKDGDSLTGVERRSGELTSIPKS